MEWLSINVDIFQIFYYVEFGGPISDSRRIFLNLHTI